MNILALVFTLADAVVISGGSIVGLLIVLVIILVILRLLHII